MPASKKRLATPESQVEILQELLEKYQADSIEKAMIGLTLEHHMIHDGYHFIMDDFDPDVDAGTAEAKAWLLRSPNNTTRVHAFFKGGNSASGRWELFEDVTVSTNGSTLEALNNDRNSDIESELIITVDPTITDWGTRVMVGYIGSGQGPLSVGGIDQRDAEIVMKQNGKYAVRFIADNASTKISLSVTFYEVRV